MSETEHVVELPSAKPIYPPGVPCWVDALVPEPRAAATFYSAVLGWEFAERASTPDGGEYLLARLGGDDVAGMVSLPDASTHPHWATYVRVDELETALQRAADAGGTVIVAPLDARPAGRVGVVADPLGATIGLWEPHAREGAQRINEPGAWAMSTLRTPDLDRAERFYANAFGWTGQPFDVGMVLFRLDGYVGGLPQQPVPRDVVAVGVEVNDLRQAQWSVEFWIDDLPAAVERATRHGAHVIAPPFDAGLFRRAVIADPAGAVFTLSQLLRERLVSGT